MGEKILYADPGNVTILERRGKFYIRYDVGAHQIAIREDEISRDEAKIAASGEPQLMQVLFALQKRLIAEGINPYQSNLDS